MNKIALMYFLTVLISFSFYSCQTQGNALLVASSKKIPIVYSSVDGIEIERVKESLNTFFIDRNLKIQR